MKRKYFDTINAKAEIEVEVNAKVAHYLDREQEKNKILPDDEFEKLSDTKQKEYLDRIGQKEQEESYSSLNQMMDNGFQPATVGTIDQEIELNNWEKEYLASREYKTFVKNLQNEIKSTMAIMPEKIRTVMFLRFFKNLSISQIAKIMGTSKSCAQCYIGRGCHYIKYFLDKDIKKQDKLEREKRMKFEQAKSKNKKNFF